MLGVDLRWDRLRWAYEFEVAMRTKRADALKGLSIEEKKKAQSSFEPGEIAHVDGGGGVNAAFYEFLLRNKFPLTPAERQYMRTLITTAPDIGKYCLVLQRLSADTFVVCYIASFGGVVHGTHLSPITRFFSMAMGDTPSWPPNTRPAHVIPRWIGSGFIFGVPVVRKNLTKTTHFRPCLAHGELQRVRTYVADRLKAFKQVHEELRAENNKWNDIRKKTGIKLDHRPDQTLKRDMHRQSRRGSPSTIPSAKTADLTSARSSHFTDLLRMKRDNTVLSLPKTRFIEIPECDHLAWLLRWQRQDIMNSQLYLKRLIPRLDASYPVLRHLPLPIRYVRP